MKTANEVELAERYLGIQWDWRFREVTEDGETFWEATITEIPDFAAYGATHEELAGNLRDAFVSHISSYIATGKRIPIPDQGKAVWYDEPRYAAAGGM